MGRFFVLSHFVLFYLKIGIEEEATPMVLDYGIRSINVTHGLKKVYVS
jgi:hypothetical protein